MKKLRDYSYLTFSRYTYRRLYAHAGFGNKSTDSGKYGEWNSGLPWFCSYVEREKRNVFNFLDASDTECARDLDFCMLIIELAAPFAASQDAGISGALSFGIREALSSRIGYDRLRLSSKSALGSAMLGFAGNALSVVGLGRMVDTRSLLDKYRCLAETVVEFAELVCILRDDERLADFRAFSAENIVNPHIQLKARAAEMKETLISSCDYMRNNGHALKSADLMDRYQKALTGW